jgi:DNA polymerase-3 subunit alpha (Gram-positive type)
MNIQEQQDYLAVDVETTGLSAGVDEMIEIGAVRVIKGRLGERFQRLICPKRGLPARITEITGITEDMLRDEEPVEKVLPEFLEFAGELPLLGHNLPFDYSFLKAACREQKISFERKGSDTLRLARILHPSLEKKTLTAMAEFYSIDPGQAHRACDDAVSCARLYLKMAEEFGADPVKRELFLPQTVQVKMKKTEPATGKQKKYLIDLLKYHRIEGVSVERLTKSEASAVIDHLRSGHLEKAVELLKNSVQKNS